jgi:SAM-dependent methyltransferase
LTEDLDFSSEKSYQGRWWQGNTEASWVGVLDRVADEVVRQLNPRRVLDASCGSGLLVKRFRDRKVDAWGLDFSEQAIAGAAPEVRPYCRVVTAGFDAGARYDLVICINTLEHVGAEGSFLRAITSVTDQLLFASTPFVPGGPPLLRARPTMEWIELLAAYGFAPNVGFDASFASPHAMLLQRRQPLPTDVAQLFSERIDRRYIVARELEDDRGATVAVELARYKERSAILEKQLAREREYLETLRGVHSYLVQEVQKLRAGTSIEPPSSPVRSETRAPEVSSAEPSVENWQLLQQQTELLASVARLERRATGLERNVQELKGLVTGILESRIWQTLVRVGGIALGVTGRGPKPS